MNYYFNLFSPETLEAFNTTDQRLDGLSMDRIAFLEKNIFGPGDKLIAYVSGLKRFIGVMEVTGAPLPLSKPRYEGDVYLFQYPVKKLVWLQASKGVHIKDLWQQLTLTKGKPRKILSYWFLPAPRLCHTEDGRLIEKILKEQSE